jgi:hypothetical protein
VVVFIIAVCRNYERFAYFRRGNLFDFVFNLEGKHNLNTFVPMHTSIRWLCPQPPQPLYCWKAEIVSFLHVLLVLGVKLTSLLNKMCQSWGYVLKYAFWRNRQKEREGDNKGLGVACRVFITNNASARSPSNIIYIITLNLEEQSEESPPGYTPFMWAGGTFFPVVLLCQFLVLARNRFLVLHTYVCYLTIFLELIFS